MYFINRNLKISKGVKVMKKLLMCFCSVLIALCGGCSEKKAKSEAVPEKGMCLIDVGTVEEYQSGHLKGAINIPLDQISARIGEAVPNKETPITLYCRSGRRSAMAAEKLKQQGYTQLRDLKGYQEAAEVLNLPIVK